MRRTALVPLYSAQMLWSADPLLTARLARVTAASGALSPQVIPSAAVLVLPLHLPLKTDRKRRAALAFVLEPHLGTKPEETHVALGPELTDQTWLCAAIDRSYAMSWLEGEEGGPLLPDILAVPVPAEGAEWAIWCSDHRIHIRLADGGGLCVARDAFADLWRAQHRPALELAYGTPPPGVEIACVPTELPDVEAAVLTLDLRQGLAPAAVSKSWRRRLRFAAVASVATILAHTALLEFDARALSHLSQDRGSQLRAALAARGASLDLSLPTEAAARVLLRSRSGAQDADPFLRLLAQVLSAIPPGSARLHDLRFDAATASLTLLLTGDDLAALQRAETGLKSQGIPVTSGAAAQTASGAEMQIVVLGAG